VAVEVGGGGGGAANEEEREGRVGDGEGLGEGGEVWLGWENGGVAQRRGCYQPQAVEDAEGAGGGASVP
jgi:hypothetical protein